MMALHTGAVDAEDTQMIAAHEVEVAADERGDGDEELRRMWRHDDAADRPLWRGAHVVGGVARDGWRGSVG